MVNAQRMSGSRVGCISCLNASCLKLCFQYCTVWAAIGKAEGTSTNNVHTTGEPGKNNQPAASSASNVGGTRLRLKLSKIFQILMVDKRFRAIPFSLWTMGNNHGSNCQSPRIQRRIRRAYTR